MEILQNLITGPAGDTAQSARVSLPSSGGLGDETARLITRLISVNALSGDETRNVLTILHAAFEKPETIAISARTPSKTVQLLHHLTDLADDATLKQQIADTITYVQTAQSRIQ